MGAFLTIVTRTFRRPVGLARCIDSVARQSDPDVEHIILHDSIGRGVGWSYENLRSAQPGGEYVFILDDDDYLIDEGFVAALKQFVVEHERPEIVFVGMDVQGRILPEWSEGLRLGDIAVSCFALRRDVWLEHAGDFSGDYGGDFHFIDAVYGCERQHTSARLERVVSRVDRVSYGEPENIYPAAERLSGAAVAQGS